MSRPPALGFAAFSGTGKTTLLKHLIPLLKAHGLKVGLLKKTHHDADTDQPGKDSYELRRAGASPVMLASPYRRAFITEHEEVRERSLAEELAFFDGSDVDLVLVEGYKDEHFPKIELHRPALGKPLLFPADPAIIAIAADARLPVEPAIPLLDLNAPAALADFILDFLKHHATD
jgi:molybdopterin-guanine dinucleotide biosynthesis protein B